MPESTPQQLDSPRPIYEHLITRCFKSGIKIEGTRIWRNQRGGNPDECAARLTRHGGNKRLWCAVSRQGERERDGADARLRQSLKDGYTCCLKSEALAAALLFSRPWPLSPRS